MTTEPDRYEAAKAKTEESLARVEEAARDLNATLTRATELLERLVYQVEN